MFYTLLGKLVWRGARWFLHRRYPDAGRKLLVGGVLAAGVVAGGAAVAARARSAGSGSGS